MKTQISTWLNDLSQSAKVLLSILAAFMIGLSVTTAANGCTDAPQYKNQVVSENVPFNVLSNKDSTMNLGETRVTVPGSVGVNQVTYKVETKCNKQISKHAVKTIVEKKPINQEQHVGDKEIVTETQTAVVPFGNQNINDSSMNQGTAKITQSGVNGSKTVTYSIVKVDGQEQSRSVTNEQVTLQPVTQITSIGTKVVSNCDPNYSGGCVPIASDVDCGGGSGNGPAYFYGTARVVGTDIYGLDGDHDGYACE